MVLERSQLVLIAGMSLALVAGMVLGLTTGLLKGPREAHAQPLPGFRLCKEWVPEGSIGAPQDFTFEVSDTSQGPPALITIPNVSEDGQPHCINIFAATGEIVVTEIPVPGFETPGRIFGSTELDPGASFPFQLFPPVCAFTFGPETLQRDALAREDPNVDPSCQITFVNSEIPDPVFRLCKEWRPQGATAAPRDFTFNVNDGGIGLSPPVTIPNVAEDGQPDCILLSGLPGLIQITETDIAGFDTPEREFNGLDVGSGFTFEFILESTFCAPANGAGLTEALVRVVEEGDANCTITFINEDNDVRTVTPTIGVCAICNATTTPPPPTATRTSPPSTATNPPSTQPPPPATPTTGVATQAPGLTDAQRTQTAVAAARTAAAQTTPIAPRTGGAAMGGAGGTLNIALFAAGLIVLSSGLGLVAMRGKRR